MYIYMCISDMYINIYICIICTYIIYIHIYNIYIICTYIIHVHIYIIYIHMYQDSSFLFRNDPAKSN